MQWKCCKICSAGADAYADIIVLGRHYSTLYSCRNCGFVFVDPVYWLDEAYRNAIALSDVGYVSRNIAASERLCNLLSSKSVVTDFFVDFGGGYGLLVRLMRDKGFRFHLHEPLVANMFARSCEADRARFGRYRALTAIEVLEHLPDPVAGIAEMAGWSPCIVFTTELCPVAKPLPMDWWYFGFEHGQHVSFYTKMSLQILAELNGLRYFELGGNWHALASEDDPIVGHPRHGGRFANATRLTIARFARALSRRLHRGEVRPSLLNDDFEAMRCISGSRREGCDDALAHIDFSGSPNANVSTG